MSTATTAAAAAAEAGAATAETTTAAAAVSLGGLEGTEEKGAEATAAQAAEAAATAAAVATAMGPGVCRFEMVLVPPQDAPVIIIQRLVRGRLMRETYKMLKVFVLISYLCFSVLGRGDMLCSMHQNKYHEAANRHTSHICTWFV